MFEKRLIHRVRQAFEAQRDESDCGPASLATIINYYGGHVALERIRLVSGTTPLGTTML